MVRSALTDQPFDVQSYPGRDIKFETCAEIIAKKMWRADFAKAEFDSIDAIGVQRSFAHCMEQARGIIKPAG